MARTGLAFSATIGPAKTTDPDMFDTPEPADSHTVRTTLTRSGREHGVELTTGTGSVFIPCWALPDLRRRLLVAQHRITAANPTPRVRKRRGPSTAK